MSTRQGTVGIIVNPSSGRDIRRLLSRASVFPNGEKINNPPPSSVLSEGAKLTLLGTTEQWAKFNARFD